MPCTTICSHAVVTMRPPAVFLIDHRFRSPLFSSADVRASHPVLEAAEKKWLKAGAVAHCGNVKGMVGLLALDLIPRPDLLITSGLLCETAPKSVDILYEIDGIPQCCYDTCQDREFTDYSGATKRMVELAAKSLREVTKKIHDVVGPEGVKIHLS